MSQIVFKFVYFVYISLLQEGKHKELVDWSEEGESFLIFDKDKFSKVIIPLLYGHDNFLSFFRQLNKYSFRKTRRTVERKRSLDGEVSSDYLRPKKNGLILLLFSAFLTHVKILKKVHEFKHPDFLKGRRDLVKSIKRDRISLPPHRKEKKPGSPEPRVDADEKL
jgi:hypothetical protein